MTCKLTGGMTGIEDCDSVYLKFTRQNYSDNDRRGRRHQTSAPEVDHSAASILVAIVGSKFHIRAEINESSDSFTTALESKPGRIGLTFLLTLPLAAISADVT